MPKASKPGWAWRLTHRLRTWKPVPNCTKNRLAGHLVELGKKEAAINRFRIERDAQNVEITFQQLLTAARGEAEGDAPLVPNDLPTSELVTLPAPPSNKTGR